MNAIKKCNYLHSGKGGKRKIRSTFNETKMGGKIKETEKGPTCTTGKLGKRERTLNTDWDECKAVAEGERQLELCITFISFIQVYLFSSEQTWEVKNKR